MLKDKNKIALTFAENGEIAGIALATIKRPDGPVYLY